MEAVPTDHYEAQHGIDLALPRPKRSNSGIYSEQDLEQLREHINFPPEKPAFLQHTINQGASLTNLFDQEEIERIAEGYWDLV